MDKKTSLEMIAAISNAKGAAGFEDEVLTVLRRYGEGLGQFREDSLRNLYLSRRENRSGRPVVQLDAHSDEVSFMVQAIRPNGTLRFITLGGWVNSNIPAGCWFRPPTAAISQALSPASPFTSCPPPSGRSPRRWRI